MEATAILLSRRRGIGDKGIGDWDSMLAWGQRYTCAWTMWEREVDSFWSGDEQSNNRPLGGVSSEN
jgi:hypothetical protein